jgi:hypothetical protein
LRSGARTIPAFFGREAGRSLSLQGTPILASIALFIDYEVGDLICTSNDDFTVIGRANHKKDGLAAHERPSWVASFGLGFRNSWQYLCATSGASCEWATATPKTTAVIAKPIAAAVSRKIRCLVPIFMIASIYTVEAIGVCTLEM